MSSTSNFLSVVLNATSRQPPSCCWFLGTHDASSSRRVARKQNERALAIPVRRGGKTSSSARRVGQKRLEECAREREKKEKASGRSFRNWVAEGRWAPAWVAGAWCRPLFFGGWEHSSSASELCVNVQTRSLFVDFRSPTRRDEALAAACYSSAESLSLRRRIFGGRRARVACRRCGGRPTPSALADRASVSTSQVYD